MSRENFCVLAFQTADWKCLVTKYFSREKGRAGSPERRTERLEAAASPGGTGWFSETHPYGHSGSLLLLQFNMRALQS